MKPVHKICHQSFLFYSLMVFVVILLAAVWFYSTHFGRSSLFFRLHVFKKQRLLCKLLWWFEKSTKVIKKNCNPSNVYPGPPALICMALQDQLKWIKIRCLPDTYWTNETDSFMWKLGNTGQHLADVVFAIRNGSIMKSISVTHRITLVSILAVVFVNRLNI